MSPVFPFMPIHAFSPFACCIPKTPMSNIIRERIIYTAVTTKIPTFPCSAVMVRMTFTPQFCAKVRGIASKAMAAAS